MQTTPQIEAILDELTELCCDSLDSNTVSDADRLDQLVLNLSTNGWERHNEGSPPLSVLLKERMKDRCREPAMHRGGELDGIVSKVQKAYDNAAQFRSSAPGSENEAEAKPPRTLG